MSTSHDGADIGDLTDPLASGIGDLRAVVTRVVGAHVEDPELAEDIVQETLVRLLASPAARWSSGRPVRVGHRAQPRALSLAAGGHGKASRTPSPRPQRAATLRKPRSRTWRRRPSVPRWHVCPPGARRARRPRGRRPCDGRLAEELGSTPGAVAAQLTGLPSKAARRVPLSCRASRRARIAVRSCSRYRRGTGAARPNWTLGTISWTVNLR